MTSALGYRERLHPSWGLWLVSVVLVGMLAVAYGAAVDARLGWAIGIGLGALVVGALYFSAPVVRVGSRGLAVGRAFLPVEAIGTCHHLDATHLAEARGPGGDHRAFAVLRAGTRHGAIRIEVVDPTDPHPAWLIGSRHPSALMSALADTIGRSPSAGRAHE